MALSFYSQAPLDHFEAVRQPSLSVSSKELLGYTIIRRFMIYYAYMGSIQSVDASNVSVLQLGTAAGRAVARKKNKSQ